MCTVTTAFIISILTIVFFAVKYTKDFSGNSVTEEYSNDQFSYTGVFTVAPISGITHPRQSTIITVTFTPT